MAKKKTVDDYMGEAFKPKEEEAINEKKEHILTRIAATLTPQGIEVANTLLKQRDGIKHIIKAIQAGEVIELHSHEDRTISDDWEKARHEARNIPYQWTYKTKFKISDARFSEIREILLEPHKIKLAEVNAKLIDMGISDIE